MTDFRETPGTPEEVAARADDSMAFLSDVERKAREACNYEVSDAYQNAWLVIRDLQTALSDAEQRGQEAMRERAAKLAEDQAGSTKGLHYEELWIAQSFNDACEKIADKIRALSPTTASATTGEVGK